MTGKLQYEVGDSFRLMKRWEEVVGDRMAALVMTSPPYWGQRGYAAGPGTWGSPGESLQQWLDWGNEFGRLAAQVSTANAWLAVNLGDTMTGSGGSGGDWTSGGYAGRAPWKQGPAELGDRVMLPRQLASVPYRFADGITEDETWILRSHVIWVKPGPKPEAADHVKRPRRRYESVLLFTRPGAKPTYAADRERFQDDVWELPRASLPRVTPKPKAPWPVELCEAIIDPMSNPGDLILDPFAGSGITGLVARRMDRDAVMFDRDGDARDTYVALSRRM